jgi:hypothetical protein
MEESTGKIFGEIEIIPRLWKYNMELINMF